MMYGLLSCNAAEPVQLAGHINNTTCGAYAVVLVTRNTAAACGMAAVV
jgi:hypothetical protein